MSRKHPVVTTIKTLACVAAFAPLAALAAGTATLQNDDDIVKIQWQDTNTARFSSEDTDDYMVVQDDKVFMVTSEGGKPQVLDIGDMAQMFMAFLDDETIESMAPSELDKAEATGDTETIAGIKGEVYNISYTTEDDNTEEAEVVLTDDNTVAELTDVGINLLKTLTNRPHIGDFIESLPDGKRGILRMEDNYTLVSISDETPDDSVFELPAEPQGLQEIMQGLKDMMQ